LWRRAHGPALFTARLRSEPRDFEVTEQLGWELSGDGEHDYLWIEKTGANTQWVAQQLARFANVPVRDVGYAGLKDRQAVTRQWFSVPRWHAPDWNALAIEGVQLLDLQRHQRKLRRGAHRANAFCIVLRCSEAPDKHAVEDRLGVLRDRGVPNYYGEQRFGRDGANLRLADDWAAGRRMPRHQRSLAISTIRSFDFNNRLADRVENRTWEHLKAGDLVNLDGSGSVFEASDVDDELRHRCRAMDVHPAIALAGKGAQLEREAWQRALERARIEPGTRSLRLAVRGLASDHKEYGMVLTFTLDRGAFATSVLRELCESIAQPQARASA
jgi:tRNA pseudouridine13 synthase